ncbi:rod shape-determining protein MreC [Rhodopila sp.]|uniref:rod shape-determining protein MreC n=1 Tax=Rhodopila sp. TaxID=2480087 RepID=UPI003D146F7B
MIRLSIQARQALARMTLPMLILASFALMLLGKADSVVAERVRLALADALVPIYAAMAGPSERVQAAVTELADLWAMRAENARLRDENERLHRWQSIALALDAENQRLKASLRWIPNPPASFVTARVVADAGGVYGKAVLLSIGPHHGIRRGEIAVDERGLVGRVTDVGARTARVLLITDLNSRIPVMLEASRAHAILIGTNGSRPRLLYWPEGTVPQEGERIVTSAEADAFPANLPVGTVHYAGGGTPEVEPAAMLQKLELVRIFDYGVNDIASAEAARSPPHPQGQPASPITPGEH